MEDELLIAKANQLSVSQRTKLLEILQADHTDSDTVSIIGVGLRVSGANNILTLDALLRERRSAIQSVEPLKRSKFWHSLPEKFRDHPGISSGSFLEDPFGFDTNAFFISDREIGSVDPQQKIALEVTSEALDDAGVQLDEIEKSKIGVYFGASTNDFCRSALNNLHSLSQFSSLGAATSSISARISYEFDFTGPSMVIDSACASSLFSLHLAGKALLSGDIDLAIVGGVNTILSPDIACSLSRMGLLSPSGRCNPFMQDADGFVRGEGAIVCVLKRTRDAVRDTDLQYTELAGSSVGHDGRSNGFATPSSRSQCQVIENAMIAAGIEAREVEYVEAFGSGTPMGDAIESRALFSAYGRSRSTPLPIGSIKGVLGHLEAAAGLASVAKVCAMFSAGQTFPQPSVGQISSSVLEAFPSIDIPMTPKPLSKNAVVGVSAFGFGGANCHLILRRPDPLPAADAPAEPHVFLISAWSAKAVKQRVLGIRELLLSANESSDLRDIAHTLAQRQRHRRWRASFVASSIADALDEIEKILSDPERIFNCNASDPKLTFATADHPRIALEFSKLNIPVTSEVPRDTGDLANGNFTAEFLRQIDPSGDPRTLQAEVTATSYRYFFSLDWRQIEPIGQMVRLPPYPWDRDQIPSGNRKATLDLLTEHIDWLHRIHWVPVEQTTAGSEEQVHKPGMLFVTNGLDVRRLVEELRKNGFRCRSIETLDDEAQLSSNEHIIWVTASSGQKGSADRLSEPALADMKELSSAIRICERVALWCDVQLTVVTAGPEASEKDAVSEHLLCGDVAQGILQAVPFETPGISCQLVDLNGHSIENMEVASHFSDLMSRKPAETILMLREGIWLTPRLQRVQDLSKFESSPIDRSRSCLVVGGDGFVGRQIAKSLVEMGWQTVLLGSRNPATYTSPFELSYRSPDSNVSTVLADFSDLDSAKAALQKFGDIGAIFVCVRAEDDATSGSLFDSPESLSQFKNAADCVENADLLLPNDGTLVVVGSTLGVLGAPGSSIGGAYEAFSSSVVARRLQRGARAAHICWGPWSDSESAPPDHNEAAVLRLANPADAAKLTVEIAELNAGNVVAVPFNLTALLRTYPRAGHNSLLAQFRATNDSKKSETSASYARGDLATPFVPPETPIEREITAAWRRVLSIDKVGIDDDFFEIGGDSLAGSDIIEQINLRYGVDVKIDAAFDGFTVRKLAAIVEGKIFDRIEALDDRQAETLLEQPKSGPLE